MSPPQQLPRKNTRHSPIVAVMLAQRRRRWDNITATLGGCAVFAREDGVQRSGRNGRNVTDVTFTRNVCIRGDNPHSGSQILSTRSDLTNSFSGCDL